MDHSGGRDHDFVCGGGWVGSGSCSCRVLVCGIGRVTEAAVVVFSLSASGGRGLGGGRGDGVEAGVPQRHPCSVQDSEGNAAVRQ